MANRVEGFKLIGRIGDAYYFAQSVFEHSDGFKGVTGCVVRPVSPEEFEWASDRENVAERLQDVYEVCVVNEGKWHNRDNANAVSLKDWSGRFVCRRTRDFEDFIDDSIRFDGIENIMYDESYCCDASDAFDELDIEHECTDCVGCGRCFDERIMDDFDEIYDHGAYIAIRCLEAGMDCADDTAFIVFGRPLISILNDFDAWFDRAVKKAGA